MGGTWDTEYLLVRAEQNALALSRFCFLCSIENVRCSIDTIDIRWTVYSIILDRWSKAIEFRCSKFDSPFATCSTFWNGTCTVLGFIFIQRWRSSKWWPFLRHYFLLKRWCYFPVVWRMGCLHVTFVSRCSFWYPLYVAVSVSLILCDFLYLRDIWKFREGSGRCCEMLGLRLDRGWKVVLAFYLYLLLGDVWAWLISFEEM